MSATVRPLRSSIRTAPADDGSSVETETPDGTLPPPAPVAIESAMDPVFGMFHDGLDSNRQDVAVLICPPWGWDEITSYRARRAWAIQLAANGFPTLRIDLPAAGDSGGEPNDADRVGAWRAAVRASVGWLETQPGVRRVAIVGLGLGGLVAADAIADASAVSDLVLWAVPQTGRSWLREQRAFAALQTSRAATGESRSLGGPRSTGQGAVGDPAEPGLEVGGFLLSSETMQTLGELDLAAAVARAHLQRILLLDRDGLSDIDRIADRFRSPTATVEADRGAGWSDMVFHPEQYSEPREVFERVCRWLGEASADADVSVAANGRGLASPTGLAVRVGAAEVREAVMEIPRPGGELFGIVSEPTAIERRDLAVVFLNAGAVRRIGPNRLWVETARRWAARGVPSVRMDLAGLGDADGDPAQYRDVGRFYTPSFGADVAAIVDEVVRRGLGTRVVLVGLCAGGYWAFHTAVDDERVVGALILNPRAMIWDDGLLERREGRKVAAGLTASGWRRIVHGEVPLSRIAAVSRAAAVSAARAIATIPSRTRLRLTRGSSLASDPVERRLDVLASRDVRVLLAFSGSEPVRDELAADGVLDHLERWRNARLATLPGDDHTLRPLAAQLAAAALLDEELDLVLDRLQRS